MEDAFHVVLPALPGFGFSDKPRDTGVGVPQIAEMWEALMARLGYQTYHAHGGDWGSIVTQAILMQQTLDVLPVIARSPLVPPDMSRWTSLCPRRSMLLHRFSSIVIGTRVTQSSRAPAPKH